MTIDIFSSVDDRNLMTVTIINISTFIDNSKIVEN